MTPVTRQKKDLHDESEILLFRLGFDKFFVMMSNASIYVLKSYWLWSYGYKYH